jgi:hypothetical protein
MALELPTRSLVIRCQQSESVLMVVKSVTRSWRRHFMADLYTCSCGNQTWEIFDTGVRCTTCQAEYVTPHTPVAEFNSAIAQEMEEELAE